MGSRFAVLASLIFSLAAFGLLPIGLFTYACLVPIDVSGSPAGGLLPAPVREFKERDEVAFPAHFLLGRALEGARCNPVAVGFQLIKAGAHANTDAEVRDAGSVLALSRSRAADRQGFDDQVCAVLGGGFARPQQEEVAKLAGTSCNLSS